MARDITVSFDDGTQHVYANAPDDVTPDQVQARAQQDFGKKVVSLDGGNKAAASSGPGMTVRFPGQPPQDSAPAPAPAPRTGFNAVPTEAEAQGQPYQAPDAPPTQNTGLAAQGQAVGEAGVNLGSGLAGSLVGSVIGLGRSAAENLGLADPTGTPRAPDLIPAPNGPESDADKLKRQAANRAIVANAKNAPHVPVSADEGMANASADATARIKRSVSGPMDLNRDAPPDSSLGQDYTDATAPAMDTLMSTMNLHGTMGPHTGITPMDIATQIKDSPDMMAVRAGLNKVGEGIKSTAQDVGNVVSAPAKAAVEAAAQSLSKSATPEQVRDATTATDADIPLAPHQFSPNNFIKKLGEASETLPLTGGDDVRATRAQRFSGALAKVIDPDTEHTVLNSDALKDLQDTAGETIGDVASRTDIPLISFPDISDEARNQDPAIRSVIDSYAKDLQKVAAENDGVVPGTTLREIRTRAQTQSRGARAGKGDLANALDTMVSQFDEALTKHAPDDDMVALLKARRQYAITKTLEPLISKYPDGNIPPSALKAVITSTAAGKHRMATGTAGPLGDYAMLGQNLLKDQASSGTAERSALYKMMTSAVAATKGVALAVPARIYNAYGPKVVRRMVEIQRRKNAILAAQDQGKAAPAFNPSTTQGFGWDDENPGGWNDGTGPTAPPKPGPLGDVSPDWETQPGAGGAPPPAGIDPAGLHPAVGDEPPLPQGMPAPRPGSEIPLADNKPLGDISPSWETTPGAGEPPGGGGAVDGAGLHPAVDDARVTTGPARDLRNGLQIPAVEGRPDLPDSIQVGRPAEAAGTDADNAAMGTPGAQAAMAQQGQSAAAVAPPYRDPRLQEVDRLREGETSPAVLQSLATHEKQLKQRIATEQADAQARVDAIQLRRAAAQTTDLGLKKSMLDRAETLYQQPATRAIAAFKDIGKRAKIDPAVIKITLNIASKMDPQEVPAYLTRAIPALEAAEVKRRALPKADGAQTDELPFIENKVPPEELHALTVDDTIKVPDEPKVAKTATEGAKTAPEPVPRETVAQIDEADTPIARAARDAATHPENARPEPTDAQKEAENYKIGRDTETIAGERLSVENGAGSTRRGVSPDGKPWSTAMNDHYGRILGTVGMDSTEAKAQHVDFFVKRGTEAAHDGPVFVVDQVDPKTGKPDEHKVMFGYDSIDDARRGYLSHYEPGWKGLGAITETSLEDFKKWVHSDATSKPFAKDEPVQAGRGRPENRTGAAKRESEPPPVQDSGPGKPRALSDKEAFANDYKGLEGRDITHEVELSDSGKKATLTIDAAKAMRGLDKRLSDLEALKACLKG